MKTYNISELRKAIIGRQNCILEIYSREEYVKIPPEIYAEIKARNIELILVNRKTKNSCVELLKGE